MLDTSSGVVKLKGFGFAKTKSVTSNKLHSTNFGFKLYEAPEMDAVDVSWPPSVLCSCKLLCVTMNRTRPPAMRLSVSYDEKVDIFSLAVTGFEIITGEVPAAHQQGNQPNPYRESYRPSIPAYVPAQLQLLLQDCWATNAATRPTAKHVADSLEIIKQQLIESAASLAS